MYFDEVMGQAVSKFVPAEQLIVPYDTSDLDTCPNVTHIIRMGLNDLRKQQLAGVYRDINVIPVQGDVTEVQGEINRYRAWNLPRLTMTVHSWNVMWIWT